MADPQNQSQPVDYAALAKQAGAISSVPPPVDYDALAKQAGAISSTPASATHPDTLSAEPSASEIPTFGYPTQSPEQRLSMPLVKMLLPVLDVLHQAKTLTQAGKVDHPIMGKIGDLANNIEELLTGGQSAGKPMGTKSGVINNPVTAAIMPGGELAGGAEAAEPAASTTAQELGQVGQAIAKRNPFRGGEDPGIVRQIIQGRDVAQPGAQAAIRTAVGAGAETPILEDAATVADARLANLKTQENAAYKQIDDTVGFDLKAANKRLSDAEYELSQPGTPPAKTERLGNEIMNLRQQISEADAKLKSMNIDPTSGAKLFKAGKAGQQFKTAIVNSTNPDGSVDVEKLLDASKKLRFNPKYGDRLAQFFGSPEAANQYMEKLDQMQKMGARAVTTRKVAEWLAGLAIGGEVVNAVARTRVAAGH